MSILNKKLMRDLKAYKAQFISVGVLVILGVTFFSGSMMGFKNLVNSYAYTYNKLSFADYTVRVDNAPKSVVEEVDRLEGVKRVHTRTVFDGRAMVKGERVWARFIGIPTDRRPPVNDILLKEGDHIQHGDEYGCLITTGFIKGTHVEVGTIIIALVKDKEIPLTVRGIVTSPEYLLHIPDKKRMEIFLTPGEFCVLFISERMAERLAGSGRTGEINEILFLTDERNESVFQGIRTALAPYNIISSYSQEEQTSNWALSMDIKELKNAVIFYPLLFLGVAVITIYIMMTRIVHTQRSQIGIMRAMGYSRMDILVHYLSYGCIVGIVGGIIGGVLGNVLARYLTEIYANEIGVPLIYNKIYPSVIIEGIMLSFLSCLLSIFIPAKRAADVPPALTIRGTPPPTSGILRRLIIKRIFPLLHPLSTLWLIPLRNVLRNIKRTSYTIIGIVLAAIMVLACAAFIDSATKMYENMFQRTLNFDLTAVFYLPQPLSRLDKIARIDGVESVSRGIHIPCGIGFKGKTISDNVIEAYKEDDVMRGFLDKRGILKRIPEEGVLLSSGLKEALGVARGDVIIASTMFGDWDLKVVDFVDELFGSGVAISIKRAEEFLDLGEIFTTIFFKIDHKKETAVKKAIEELPSLQHILVKRTMKEGVDKYLVLFWTLVGVMFVLGLLMTFALIFIMMTVNILERSRELATMRILGFSNRDVGFMITFENLVVVLLGLIPGVLVGKWVGLKAVTLYNNEFFTLSGFLYPSTIILSLIGIFLTAFLTGLPWIRRLNRMNLTEVTREHVG